MPCSEWKSDNNYTTQFCLKMPQSNWTKAEDSCKQTNGHLASILNPTEEHAVRNLIVDTKGCGKDWWIGLKWEGRFTWSDQSPFKNLKNIESEKCFSLHKDKDEIDWRPKDCKESYCFLCKHTWIASSASSMSLSGDGTNTETTAFFSTSAHPLPTKSRTLHTMSRSQWKSDNNYFTHFFLNKSKSNWTKAEDSCKQTNGHLASILNPTEEHAVRNLIVDTKGCGKDWWIGLKWEGRFTWSDQSPFKNLKNIESEKCFSLHKDKDEIDWRPKDCKESYCFLCKHTWIASSASSMSLSGDGTNTETTAFISTSAHPLPAKSRTLCTTYATISTSFTPTPINSTISTTVPLSGLIMSPTSSSLLYKELTSTPFSLTPVPSTTSTKKGSNMPVKLTDAGTSSAGVGNSHIDTEIALPTVTLPPVLAPTIKRSSAGTTSPGVGNSQLYTEITSTTADLPPVLSPTIKGSSAGTASPDVGNSQLYTEITSTTVDLPRVLSPTINRSGADTSSAGPIGGSVAGVCVAMAIVSVVLYVCCRKRKHRLTRQQSQGCN